MSTRAFSAAFFYGTSVVLGLYLAHGESTPVTVSYVGLTLFATYKSRSPWRQARHITALLPQPEVIPEVVREKELARAS